MADYTYRIYSGASNTAPNFTTINGAVADFKASDRTSSGTNGRIAANSTLYIKLDGFLSSGGDEISGIDTTTNSNAAIIVEAYSNAWNATARAIGYTTAYDGLDTGASGSFNIGAGGTPIANVTVRNLVLRNANNSGYAPIECYGTAASVSVNVQNCFIHSAATTAGKVALLWRANMRNCVLYAPSMAATTQFCSVVGPSSGTALIEHCDFIMPAGSSTAFVNDGDPLPLVKNSYFAGFTTFASSGTWSTSCVGNATDQGSGPANWTSTLTSVALSTTNFNNVTSGTEDFRVKSGSVLKTTGATRLTGVTTDIFSVSRADPTTIGAYEYVSSTGPWAPSSDVTVTGWTSSAGGALYATIDEASYDDGDYIVSPTISGSTAPATFGLGSTLAAGNYTIGIRAKTSTGTATMRVYLVNDSGTSQGVTADQTITSTYTTYSLPVTTTGSATRAKVEIVT